MQMKRFLTNIFLLLLVVACSNEVQTVQYSISGKIEGSDSLLYVVGLDSRYESMDTIACNKNGEFTYSLPTDTVVPLALLLPSGQTVTLYAAPGRAAALCKDSTLHSGWRVEGGGTIQELHDSISRVLDGCNSYTEQTAVIDSFIKHHPVDEVCVELIRRYLVNIPHPVNKDIRQRIQMLSGVLQDHEFFTSIQSRTEQNNSNYPNRMFPTFEFKPNDSTNIKPANYLNKFLLVTFCASWDSASRSELQQLRALDDSVKSSNFAMLNISLDHDTAEWNRFIEHDSIIGDNVCDMLGWQSELVQKLNIGTLPYSLLLTPYQRIIRYNVSITGDAHFIDSITTKHDRQQQENQRRNRVIRRR
ncbi:MAG: DUF4369 domain-containing protein [Bacteroidales bacterium]|nr:DUF4369 domain-containing protein [Bacteroidales bacterium]